MAREMLARAETPEAEPAGSPSPPPFWAVTDILRATETLPSDAPSGPVAFTICILARPGMSGLDQTLDSLQRAAFAFEVIVLRKAGDLATEERLTGRQSSGLAHVALPIDPGEPAARNWLLAREDVRRAEAVVFLRPGVEVEAETLEALAAALATHPEAVSAGCAVVDRNEPSRLLAGERFLSLCGGEVELARSMDLRRATSAPATLESLSAQAQAGRFAYSRPALLPPEGCQMWRVEALLSEGGFALGLSPDGPVDLAMDIRLGTRGRFGRFCGQVQAMAAVESSSTDRAAGLGNRYKLGRMFEAAELLRLDEAFFGLLEQDLLRRMDVLERTLLL